MINTGQIAISLRPGLNAMFGLLPTYPDQWKEIYKSYTSDMYQEIDVEMRYLGPAAIKPEGQPISTDTMGQRIITNYIHKRIGLSFSITKEAIEDNLYTNEFPQKAEALRESLRVTRNILAANVLNNGFNPAYPIGDGQPLFSTSHPIDGGVYSNTQGAGGPPVALSQTGLEVALINIQTFPQQSGILSQTMGQKLIVHRAQQFNVSRILNSRFMSDNANNAVNPLYTANNDYLPQGYRINQFLDNPNAYFVLTDASNGFKHFQRNPVETDTYADYSTDTILCKATERLSYGVTNPRGGYGVLAQ